MAWGRTDDRACLDSRVGQLTDPEYRARDALMQFCLREHRDTGIFPAERIVAAAYATPTGPRAVTKKQLEQLKKLGFVREKTDYTDQELEALDIEWPNEEGWLRINAWEKYNPPRDTTNADRQRRYRKRHTVSNTVTQDEGNAVTNAPVTDPRTRAPRASSVPSRPVTPPTLPPVASNEAGRAGGLSERDENFQASFAAAAELHQRDLAERVADTDEASGMNDLADTAADIRVRLAEAMRRAQTEGDQAA